MPGGTACLFRRSGSFFLALSKKVPYHANAMRLNALLILALLVIVVAAPIVDAVACDDCRDIVPRRDMQQHLSNRVNHSDGDSLPSDTDHDAQQETGTAQNLCPVCANIAAAMGNACCGAPSMISQANVLPHLLALSDPSYPINKPPQN